MADTVTTYSGDWGTLVTVGVPYPGFSTYENKRYIIVVLGGPLPRHNEEVATGELPHDGTEWILSLWKDEQSLRWDKDFVGHFLVLRVDKEALSADLVTDINAFVPAYSSTAGSNVTILGSHADAVAKASGNSHDIDIASVADFLSFLHVCYPYTFYNNVKHLPPASVSHLTASDVSAYCYWEPKEAAESASISETAEQLRAIMHDNIARICARQRDVSILISGGLDSRVVASMVPRSTLVRGVTFSDYYNREARIAQEVCSAIGAKWQLLLRDPCHYLNHVTSSVCLSESHNQFRHAHANGFPNIFPDGVRVLGGLSADAYFKASHLKYMGARKNVLTRIACSENPHFKELSERRRNNDASLKKIRPQTYTEWNTLYPACMHTSMTNLFVNRRLMPSYEPFVDSMVFKLAANTPQSWKVNDELFCQAMRPVLKKTWWIPHADGTYPYHHWMNIVIRMIRGANRRIKSIYRDNSCNNEGPWPNWARLSKSAMYKKTIPDVRSAMARMDDSTSKAIMRIMELAGDKPTATNRFLSLQIRIWLNML